MERKERELPSARIDVWQIKASRIATGLKLNKRADTRRCLLDGDVVRDVRHAFHRRGHLGGASFLLRRIDEAA